MKQVTVLCKNGEAEISVSGVKGPACKELTAGLEAALGGTVISDRATPEMDERPVYEGQHQDQM